MVVTVADALQALHTCPDLITAALVPRALTSNSQNICCCINSTSVDTNDFRACVI